MCPLSTHGWHCSFQLQSIQALCFSPPSSKVSTPHLQEPHSESHHREGSAVPLHSCEDTDIQNPSHTHTHLHTHGSFTHVCTCAHTHTHTRTKSHIPALLCVEGLLGTLTLGTEWSRSSPRLMCAHTLLLPTPLALTHRPSANPLLQRSHPSTSQRGLLRGARSLGLSYMLSPSLRARAKASALGFLQIRRHPALPESHSLARLLFICCPLQTPLTQAARLCC